MWYLFAHNKFFSVALICTLLAVMTVFATSYKISKWSHEIQTIRSSSARNEILIKNFEKQLSLYQGGFQEKAESLFNVRPGEEQLVTFLNKMDQMAAYSGVRNFSLRSIEKTFRNKTSSPDFATLRYRATFEATPETMRSFVKNFEVLPHYMEITELLFQGKDGLSLEEFGDASLTFDIYIRSL